MRVERPIRGIRRKAAAAGMALACLGVLAASSEPPPPETPAPAASASGGQPPAPTPEPEPAAPQEGSEPAAPAASPETPAAPPAFAAPVKPPFTKYESMLGASPFGEASAEAPQEAQPNFAQDLFLAGLSMGLDGKERVYVGSRNGDQKSIVLRPDQPVDGIELIKVDWESPTQDRQVTIRKGGEVATLKYDQAVFAAAASPVPTPNAPVPHPPPTNPGQINRSGVPGQVPPARPPRVRRIIRPNPRPAN